MLGLPSIQKAEGEEDMSLLAVKEYFDMQDIVEKLEALNDPRVEKTIDEARDVMDELWWKMTDAEHGLIENDLGSRDALHKKEAKK